MQFCSAKIGEFDEMNLQNKKLMKYKILLLCLMSFLLFDIADSRPAHRGILNLKQPDGTSFRAIFSGDEFLRIKATENGYPIIQDKDGWWCYALYDSKGHIHNTGAKIGKDAIPSEACHVSGIPLQQMAERAYMKRLSAQPREATPIMQRMKSGNAVKNVLVILVQFADTKFKHTKEDFINLLTQEGYSRNGGTGSAKEYLEDQFNSNVEFKFHISDIITLDNNLAYYGGNDEDGSDRAPAKMIEDACKAADTDIDFSMFDDDLDSQVDNVFVFYAGGDEAEGAGEDCIWPHSWFLRDGAGIFLKLDGVLINRYACTAELSYQLDGRTAELCGIGTFCHEYSHTLGLPDLYDTDYDAEDGWAAGVWHHTSLMDGGNQNNHGNTPPYYNALEREILGINKPIVLEKSGKYTMDPIHRNNRYYRIETDVENEYYLLEFRSNEGWDKYIKGNGMLVYHIDKTGENIRKWEIENKVNSSAMHQCADLIEADGRKDSFSSAEECFSMRSSIGGIFFPYGDVNSLTGESSPGFRFWSGETCPYAITNITKADEEISFSFITDSDETPPTPVNIRYDTFQDAAIISFESDRPHSSAATITWWESNGKDKYSAEVFPYSDSQYAIVLEGLKPRTSYTISVVFNSNGIEGDSAGISFMTRSMIAGNLPFIYLRNVQRNEDGTFPPGAKLPLRIHNIPDAEQVRWTFDGNEVKVSSDCYFTVNENGVLKAYITYTDGTTDVIMKEIIIAEPSAL